MSITKAKGTLAWLRGKVQGGLCPLWQGFGGVHRKYSSAPSLYMEMGARGMRVESTLRQAQGDWGVCITRRESKHPGKLAIWAFGVVAIALILAAGCEGSSREKEAKVQPGEVKTQPVKSPPENEAKVQPVVKAERLEIVDKDGVARAVLTTIEGGRASLTLIDNNGEFRAWLFLSSNGSPNLILVDNPRLILMDKAGEIRSAQRLDENGSPIYSFTDGDGRVRSLLRLGEGGAPVLQLYDISGNPVWSAP